MNADKFVDYLDKKVKPEIERLRIGEPLILMDYATPHSNSKTKKYLNESGWTWLPHAPYSPGISINSIYHFILLIQMI
jgi:hypothetical protein